MLNSPCSQQADSTKQDFTTALAGRAGRFLVHVRSRGGGMGLRHKGRLAAAAAGGRKGRTQGEGVVTTGGGGGTHSAHRRLYHLLLRVLCQVLSWGGWLGGGGATASYGGGASARGLGGEAAGTESLSSCRCLFLKTRARWAARAAVTCCRGPAPERGYQWGVTSKCARARGRRRDRAAFRWGWGARRAALSLLT